MTPGWKLACWIIGMALMVIQAVRLRRLPVEPGWLGLAVFVLPFAWDAASA